MKSASREDGGFVLKMKLKRLYRKKSVTE